MSPNSVNIWARSVGRGLNERLAAHGSIKAPLVGEKKAAFFVRMKDSSLHCSFIAVDACPTVFCLQFFERHDLIVVCFLLFLFFCIFYLVLSLFFLRDVIIIIFLCWIDKILPLKRSLIFLKKLCKDSSFQ